VTSWFFSFSSFLFRFSPFPSLNRYFICFPPCLFLHFSLLSFLRLFIRLLSLLPSVCLCHSLRFFDSWLTSHPITALVGSRLWKITVVIGWLTERCSEWDITLKIKIVNLQKCADRRRLWDWRRNWHSHEILIRLFPDDMKMVYAINFAKFWTSVCTPRASGIP